MASIYTYPTLATVSLYQDPQASCRGHNAFLWSLLVSFHIIALNAFCPSLLAPLTLRILCRDAASDMCSFSSSFLVLFGCNVLYEVLLVLAGCIDRWALLRIGLLAAAAHGPATDEKGRKGRNRKLCQC